MKNWRFRPISRFISKMIKYTAIVTMDELFSAVMANSYHVLHHMLPDRTSHPYTLRPRRHDCSLTIKEDARNFVTRLLYKHMY